MKLIDKNAVVAQANIEITGCHIAAQQGFLTEFGNGKLEGLEGIVDFINTLDVKEVDLEKEINNEIDNLSNLYCYMEDLFNGNEEEGVYPIPEKVKNELFEFAQHFFELGLKVQKRE